MCFYPLSHFLSHDKFSSPYKAFVAAIILDVEPSRFFKTVSHLPWREAMKSEIEALELNGTWDLTHLPQGKKALGCTWIIRLNASLVVLLYGIRLA